MSNDRLTAAELSQFTGSEHWYRHGLVRGILYTAAPNTSPTRAAPIGSSTRSRSRSASRKPSPPKNFRSGNSP